MTLADRRLEIHPAADWGDRVAAELAGRIAANPDIVVCLPTGATPGPLYERLPAALAAARGDAGRATVVLLDEYLGLPADHPARCDAMLRTGLLARLQPAVGHFIAFDVDGGGDPAVAAARYDAAVEASGGLDLVLLGLGRNGHVGMNEPGSEADARTRVVDLAPSTQEAARGYGADPVPTRGLTLGLAGIRSALEIWLLATGRAKKDILAATLASPRSPDLPASLLLNHPGLRIIVDEDAAEP